MLFESKMMRMAMRQWTTGVTIVTAEFNGFKHGMTVSSFTSVAIEPPTVLISLAETTRTFDLVSRSGAFGVIILDESQQALSERFAGNDAGTEDKFEGLSTHTWVTGAPFFDGGLARFDCRVVDTRPSGLSTVFFAEVVAAEVVGGGNPLLYYNRTYHLLKTD